MPRLSDRAPASAAASTAACSFALIAYSRLTSMPKPTSGMITPSKATVRMSVTPFFPVRRFACLIVLHS